MKKKDYLLMYLSHINNKLIFHIYFSMFYLKLSMCSKTIYSAPDAKLCPKTPDWNLLKLKSTLTCTFSLYQYF